MNSPINNMAPMFMSAAPPPPYHPQDFGPYMPNGGHMNPNIPSNPNLPSSYFSSAMQAMLWADRCWSESLQRYKANRSVVGKCSHSGFLNGGILLFLEGEQCKTLNEPL